MNFRKYLDIINESKMVSDIMSKLDSKVSELESNGEPVLFVYKRSKGGIRFFPKKGVDGKARPKLDQLENPENLNHLFQNTKMDPNPIDLILIILTRIMKWKYLL